MATRGSTVCGFIDDKPTIKRDEICSLIQKNIDVVLAKICPKYPIIDNSIKFEREVPVQSICTTGSKKRKLPAGYLPLVTLFDSLHAPSSNMIKVVFMVKPSIKISTGAIIREINYYKAVLFAEESMKFNVYIWVLVTPDGMHTDVLATEGIHVIETDYGGVKLIL